jgi:hypothetical protein
VYGTPAVARCERILLSLLNWRLDSGVDSGEYNPHTRRKLGQSRNNG